MLCIHEQSRYSSILVDIQFIPIINTLISNLLADTSISFRLAPVSSCLITYMTIKCNDEFAPTYDNDRSLTSPVGQREQIFIKSNKVSLL